MHMDTAVPAFHACTVPKLSVNPLIDSMMTNVICADHKQSRRDDEHALVDSGRHGVAEHLVAHSASHLAVGLVVAVVQRASVMSVSVAHHN